MDGDAITNQIKQFTVRIKTIDGTDLGTGTIVTKDGVIATCFHVIKDKDKNRPYESVKLYFSPDFDSTKREYYAEILTDKRMRGMILHFFNYVRSHFLTLQKLHRSLLTFKQEILLEVLDLEK